MVASVDKLWTESEMQETIPNPWGPYFKENDTDARYQIITLFNCGSKCAQTLQSLRCTRQCPTPEAPISKKKHICTEMKVERIVGYCCFGYFQIYWIVESTQTSTHITVESELLKGCLESSQWCKSTRVSQHRPFSQMVLGPLCPARIVAELYLQYRMLECTI